MNNEINSIFDIAEKENCSVTWSPNTGEIFGAENTQDLMLMDVEGGINSEIQRLYKKHCEQLKHFFLPNLKKADCIQRKYYVYQWFTLQEPKRIFYVGKGTGGRKHHIKHDIVAFEKGKKTSSLYERYKLIRDNCGGIDFEIILKDITEFEAILYEECLKLELLENGEVLVVEEGIPQEYLPEFAPGRYSNIILPTLSHDRFYERYMNVLETPHFDEVSIEGLKRPHCKIDGLWLDCLCYSVEEQVDFISKWVNEHGGRYYKSLSTKTETVIVYGLLHEDTYLKYRERNLNIYSLIDVIEFIKKFSG